MTPMHGTHGERSFPTRLWLASLLAIVLMVAVGAIVSRAQGHTGSPIIVRLAAAAIVTALAAVARFIAGPRAAAATAVAGVLIAVVVLTHLA